MKKIVLIFLAAISTAVALKAQDSPEPPRQRALSFAYDVDFENYFDNRENGYGDRGQSFSECCTIFSTRLTPYIGFRIDQSPETTHRIMAGVNIQKDFGSHQTKGELFRDVLLYYDLRTKLTEKLELDITAGIFPKKFSQGRYTEAFYSDSLRFYDPNYEGLLIRFNRPKSHYEIGIDWFGMKQGASRERFMIFSASEGYVTDWLKLGYAAFMYHYAASEVVWGVCDNILANPYVEFDFAKMTGLQKLYANLGYLQSAQRDRRNEHVLHMPMGGELETVVQNWGVGIRNKLYYGYDLFTLYTMRDFDGNMYGANLYFGEPYYRVRTDNLASVETGTAGIYDRLEVYWEPHIARGLDFKVAAIFHFNGYLSGSQQIISLKANLNEIMGSRFDRPIAKTHKKRRMRSLENE